MDSCCSRRAVTICSLGEPALSQEAPSLRSGPEDALGGTCLTSMVLASWRCLEPHRGAGHKLHEGGSQARASWRVRKDLPLWAGLRPPEGVCLSPRERQ